MNELVSAQKKSSIYLNIIINNIAHQAFWKDKNSVFLGCNKAFATSAGLDNPEEIIGKTDFDLPWSNANSQAYQKDDQEVIRARKPKLNIEEVQVTKEGKKIILLTSKVPLVDQNDQVIGVLGIYSDITDRKNVELKLKQALRDCERANEAKSEFIANMSHDIRTPITGMLGLIQEVLNEANNKNINTTAAEFSETVKHNTTLLKNSTNELLQFCNEILDVISLESGAPTEKTVSFNLRELIQHNIILFQPAAEHKKLELSYEIDKTVPTHFNGIRLYLDRILLNLISNSLKFTENGFVKVKVQPAKENKLRDAKGKQHILQITVEDTGIGIPKEKFDTIFDHFTRLTPAYEGLYKGAGLGLYTVKRYVEGMNGKISVESEIKKGTQFMVTLPLTACDNTNRIEQSTQTYPVEPGLVIEPQIKTPPEVSQADASILIVEDNFLAAKALQVSLAPFHCATDITENGEQAVQLAEKNDYKLIFMDIGLPDFSGVEVTKRIRSLTHAKRSQVPIVAVTGHAGNAAKRQESLHAGMQDIIDKPAPTGKLESTLKQFVLHDSSPGFTQKRNETVIDWGACVRMCSGSQNSACELLELLEIDLNTSKEKLERLYEAYDTKALRDELHRIRGGACYVKVPQLEQALQIFHEAVKEESQGSPQLATAYLELQKAITAFNKEYRILISAAVT